uniref:Uncharacterized protein n=1 Tax=Timema monikensis TaxID=170555 RepID=A0A7R9E0Y2_9NEOP|nr:unnamed protein product [Timema monikensis]
MRRSVQCNSAVAIPPYTLRSGGSWCSCRARLDKTMTEKTYTEDKDAMFNHILVDEKHKLLYCYVPKVMDHSYRKQKAATSRTDFPFTLPPGHQSDMIISTFQVVLNCGISFMGMEMCCLNAYARTTKTLLNHLQKHPGKYKEFLDENNKKDLPAPAPRKDRTVQQNIQTMLSREKMVSSHPYAQTTTNKITNMLVKGLLPYSFVEEEGFVELVKHFAPNYKIPARTTFSRNYLAVDDSKSECPGVKKLLQKAKNIVGHYRRSSQARERLHSLQERMQVPQLELIQYVETRWSSEYCMLQRLVEMKGPIAAELAQSEHNIEPLTNADWAQAKGVLEVLEPLAQATKEISGDSYPTSSMVIPILHCLSSHLNSRIQRQEEANLSTALRNELYRDFEEMDSTADEPEPSTSNSGLWSFFDSLPNERKEMNISEEVEKYLSEPRVACTNWKRIFMLLTGQTNTTDVLAIPASAAHEKSIFTKLITRLEEELRCCQSSQPTYHGESISGISPNPPLLLLHFTTSKVVQRELQRLTPSH